MSLRFHQRHIHKTVANYVETGLTSLGWVNDPVNFGATAVTFMETQPEEEGKAIVPNLVAISVGNEDTDDLEELGGGLYSVQIPFFFDVYGDGSSLSVSIASDIKDLMTRDMVIYVKDWTDPVNPVEVSEMLYFEDVLGPEKPDTASVATDFRRHWRVVKAIAHVYYGPSATPVSPPPVLLVGVSAGAGSVVSALTNVHSAPPLSTSFPSDLRANAPFIDTLTGSVTFDNTTYTNTSDPPFESLSGSGGVVKSSWVKYVCAVTGTAMFSTVGSGQDTLLVVYDSAGTVVGSDDDSGGGGTSLISACPVAAGTTYYIRNGNFAGSSGGSVSTFFNWNVPG